MKTKYWFYIGYSSLLLVTALFAAEPADESSALRTALRDKILEVRTAQSDLAALQASQGAITEENKALSVKYEALKKQITADRTVADKTVAGLNAQLAEEKQKASKLNDALVKAKAEGEREAQTARVAETQGARLSNENILVGRRIADVEAKNLALFLVANEILSRYEEFSLGTALRAKEPFVGLTRTKLENLVQDYQDKIQDQRARP